jgi:putative Holliday junction resolvase
MTSFCENVLRDPEEQAAAAVATASIHPTSRFTAAIILLSVRVLGIDYGARRVGFALSDASGTLASPWRMTPRPVSETETLERMVEQIEQLLAEEDGLAAVVVGWPRRLDGSPTDQTPIVEAFARALGRRVSVPVVLQDERLSSREAEARLALRERDWRRRKGKLDAAAAAIILQDYLDAHA